MRKGVERSDGEGGNVDFVADGTAIAPAVDGQRRVWERHICSRWADGRKKERRQHEGYSFDVDIGVSARSGVGAGIASRAVDI